ncbi:hypothetical protein AALO_G00177360 [Alosa alosa]|uniref:Uncharacterized protein n=2 Tax=Alosa alosa TaxID=278164 RepID=A0AAV6GBI3_9TELE|nr:hypothetical protein AALO_G00177360 [Alosa alosa]
MAMASKDGGQERAAVVRSPPTPVVTPSKTAKAWATAVQSPPVLRSFRDVLEEEVKRVKTPPAAPVAVGNPGPAVGLVPGAKRVTFKCAESSDTDKPAGPWVRSGVGSPPAGAAVTFAAIVEEERKQEAALIRSREKPLALIQIEERAIQDLLLHYRAANNPDELIVVERAPLGPIATPTWNKH